MSSFGSTMLNVPVVPVTLLSDLKKLMLTSVGGGTFVVVVIDCGGIGTGGGSTVTVDGCTVTGGGNTVMDGGCFVTGNGMAVTGGGSTVSLTFAGKEKSGPEMIVTAG